MRRIVLILIAALIVCFVGALAVTWLQLRGMR